MTTMQLILRGLRFYWRTHLGVAAGAAVATAVLVGALVVGDSVRYSLRELALARLGDTRLAMAPADRTFTGALADRYADRSIAAAPVLDLNGLATVPGEDRRADGIHVLGVDDRFWQFGDTPSLFDPSADDGNPVVLNRRLAEQLDAEPGDRVLLRVLKPSALSRDIPLGSEVENSVRLSVTVRAIIGDERFGRFSLQATQIPPFNAFVPLSVLQEAAQVEGRVNTLLVSGNAEADGETVSAADANAALEEAWTLADANLELRALEEHGVLELRTERVFLDPAAVEAAGDAIPALDPGAAPGAGARHILTYFVNELRPASETQSDPERATPYSMVTALDPPPVARSDHPLPPDMTDDQIVITQWLADDLSLGVGDDLTLTYFVFGTAPGLVERSTTFRVRAIVPTEGPGGDRELMPEFSGLADAESVLDWNPPPALQIDLDKIRDQDEQYWEEHRGAPKAFVTLDWARERWGNRFGQLTAMRWDLADHPRDQVAAAIRDQLDPASIGMFFEPVREQALAASAGGTDFGALFIGLSFFLMVAAMLLTALLFAFGIEQRTAEVGTLLALGFTPRRVRWIWLLEGGLLAVIGSLIGLALGVAYTKGVLWALRTMWRDAVGTTSLQYHAQWSTLMIGAAAGVIVALVTMWWVLRKHANRPARALLASRFGLEPSLGAGGPGERRRIGWGLWIGVVSILTAVGIVGWALMTRDHAPVGAFFGAGAMLLIGGLCLCGTLLRRAGRGREAADLTLGKLGWRNSGRRTGRSLATISMLACGCFLVVSINAFRHDPADQALQRDSGTGGFALYAQTALPVYHDLDSPRGRTAYPLLTDGAMEGVSFVQMRLREGDDASCLNLNRPQTPPLLGVDPDALAGRFVFVKTLDGQSIEQPWQLLSANDNQPDAPVPAIVDDTVATYIIKKGLGDTLDYIDERGEAFRVKIVGTITNSILQGRLLISENQLIERYPSTAGYRVMLIDPPSPQATGAQVDAAETAVERALSDVGIDAMKATERLAMFTAVENTYLTIFGVLGGLGLVLGCIGLGLVVLRNVLERRSELALMRSLGFARQSLRWLVLSEHWILLLLGLVVGGVAALVAVMPALSNPGIEVPYVAIGLTLGAVLLSGVVWITLAAMAALRGRLIEGLRSE